LTAAIKKVVPEVVSSLRRRIEEWRRNRNEKRAMPAELWLEAVKLARQYGVHPVSTNLTISYTTLKKKVTGRPRTTVKGRSAPSFMEIKSAPLKRSAGIFAPEIEVRRPDGCSLFVRNVSGDDVSSAVDAFCGWRQ
jgi:hypothetical protein